MTGFQNGFAAKSTKRTRACTGSPTSLLFLALWSCPAAAGEASLWCTYQLITYAHEAAVFCGESIDDEHKTRYGEARVSLQRFINENARSDFDKVRPDLDDVARAHWRSKDRTQFCQSLEHSNLKDFLTAFLTTEVMTKLRQRLAVPSDPAEGTCL
jgi:hypothetical protein